MGPCDPGTCPDCDRRWAEEREADELERRAESNAALDDEIDAFEALEAEAAPEIAALRAEVAALQAELARTRAARADGAAWAVRTLEHYEEKAAAEVEQLRAKLAQAQPVSRLADASGWHGDLDVLLDEFGELWEAAGDNPRRIKALGNGRDRVHQLVQRLLEQVPSLPAPWRWVTEAPDWWSRERADHFLVGAQRAEQLACASTSKGSLSIVHGDELKACGEVCNCDAPADVVLAVVYRARMLVAEIGGAS